MQHQQQAQQLNSPEADTDLSAGSNLDIAIVGMAGRFPGANNLEEFWENLRHGVESIRFYSEEEVVESGIFPHMAKDPDFVPAAGGMDHEFDFDAEFFDFNPREAEITDPQQRVALEAAWESLESAGYNPETYDGRIGVFAGVSINTYLLFNLASNPALLDSIGHFQVMTANDKDFLATRIAYKLNLKGPAMSVQTACSTGLVAANLACQSLLNYQSDMVIAGGVSITPKGRLYKEGFIFSRDGKCRAFDEQAQGTVGGNGVGFVVLKRLDDALADGDHIHAVIKGSAINNDGSLKVGYTAPSVSGQVDVITEAQQLAGVDPDTITYMEAHGTGTLLGDPIEIAALSQAFGRTTQRKQFCAIGSVKTNIGHLDTAAGISGFIKAALCVEHAEIPPSLHFNKANPKLGLENSPFYVNTKLTPWKTPNNIPRRAAVSSFGFGGTNAHSILEQAPQREPSPQGRETQLLPVSARNPAALADNIARLGEWLKANPDVDLADVSFTLQQGRKGFAHRGFVVADNATNAANLLLDRQGKSVVRLERKDAEARIVWMFSGQGAQHVNMARGLYEREGVFRAALDNVLKAMTPYLERDLKDLIFPAAGEEESAASALAETRYTQPALFAVEYALAQWWGEQGISPWAMIGHSVGEYVAATLAGVFDLDTAARVICLRGALIHQEERGAMLSVPLSQAEVEALLNDQISLAAVNAPGLCVVSGPEDAVQTLEGMLKQKSVECRRLVVSHAFHSHMLASAERGLTEALATVDLKAPERPFISNVTGTWITPEEATSPAYWGRHLRQAVLFSQGLSRLLAEEPTLLLEVGPGQVLTTLARQHRDQLKQCQVVSSCRHVLSEVDDQTHLLTSVGNLWATGVDIDWQALHEHLPRRRVPLPTYSFQRQHYRIAPQAQNSVVSLELGQLTQGSPQLAVSKATGPKPGYVAPANDLEIQVANIWERMLGIAYISRDDDFFQLGGHSLLATQLIAEVRRATGVEVLVQSLFKTPTIAGLADAVRELKGDSAEQVEKVTKEIAVIDRGGRLPLTFHQQAVWDFERQWPGSARFNGLITLHLRGTLDLNATHFAVDEILRRHEVLRTRYRYEQGVSYAVIEPARHLEVPFVDLSQHRSALREAKLLELINHHVRQPFDLGNDLLVRPILVKISEEEHMLVMSSHYAAVDGWTIGLVIQEFAAHYAAYRNPELPKLPELPFQIVDYAAWEQETTTDASIASALDYWERQLADVVNPAPLPLDHLRSIIPSMKGATFHFSLGKPLTDAVKNFCQQQGYTQFMVFVGALNALYAAYSGSPDQVIGTMTGDREIGTENLVGALVNMLTLRTQVDENESFLSLLERVRKVTTDAYSNPAPFARVVERLNRNMVRNPLFRTVFILRSVPATYASAGDLEVELANLTQNRAVADCDITLYLQEKKGALQGYYEYNTSLFERTTIETLVRDFQGLVTDLLTNPEVPLKLLLPQPAARAPKGTALQKILSKVGVYSED